MKLLITGAAGFIASHVVEHFLRTSDLELVLMDKLGYAANGMSRLRDINAFDEKQNRVSMYAMDVSRPISHGVAKEIGQVDYIIHMAAETHVDRSITDPRPFVESNVLGTMEMLEYARKLSSLKMFIYMSTDEVFGPCYDGSPTFKEWSRYNATNPYSATKAAGEELCLAWANTYNLPMVIVHGMNNFGERQHPEKFIPGVVRKLLKSERITIHCDPSRTKAGSRSYIHARNTAAALKFILMNANVGQAGKTIRDKYNVVGEKEVDNLSLVVLIRDIMAAALRRTFEMHIDMVDFHSSRPGHDLRYALNGQKLKELGWEPPKNFEESLCKTVEWMIKPENLHWLLMD